jgi:sugar phosphate isomerase/epimerase
MKLSLFRTLWGAVPGVSGPRFRSNATMFEETSALGYAGVEGSVKFILDMGKEAFSSLLAKNDLTFIAMCFTDGPNVPIGHPGYSAHVTSSVEQHLECLERQIRDIVDLKPFLINVHGGRDYFSRAQVSQYFAGVVALQAKFPHVQICHETHRGRILYSPWVCWFSTSD